MRGSATCAYSPDLPQPSSHASSSRQRLLRGFAASAMTPVLAVFIQIVNVPLFLHRWGAATYGEWLILIAFPTYLLLSDLGFSSVAGNEMAMQVARGNRTLALAIFQSTRILITLASATMAAAAVIAVQFTPVVMWLHITHISRHDAKAITLLLVIQVLLHLQN